MSVLGAATEAANRIIHGDTNPDDVQLVAGELLELSTRLAQAEQERDEWESRLKKAVAAHTETIRKAEARLREYEEAPDE